MSKVTNSIGLKFERFLEEKFSELISTKNDKNLPDFYHPELNFWIEAKVGNILWGPRIKDYQVERFDNLDKPVIYALGFHNFHDAHKNLKQATEKSRQKFLDKKLLIMDVYFIENSLIKKIWEKEGRVNAKGTSSYCMIKKGVIKNIITNRTFKRHEQNISCAEAFYEYNKDDFLIEKLKNTNNVNYGIIMNKEHSFITNYLEKKII